MKKIVIGIGFFVLAFTANNLALFSQIRQLAESDNSNYEYEMGKQLSHSLSPDCSILTGTIENFDGQKSFLQMQSLCSEKKSEQGLSVEILPAA